MRIGFAVLFMACLGLAGAADFASSSTVPAGAAEGAGDLAAMTLASESPLILADLKELQREASLIKDDRMRRDALEILDQPRFSVVRERAPKEVEIVAKLKEAGLLTNTATTIFPSHPPMRFIAAPASPWRVHHTYPGGLVVHTLINLQSALHLAENHGPDLDLDLLRAAPIWHDCAKTMTLAWNANGTARDSEGPLLAGTGAHHIWAVAEAAYRGYPPKFILVLAAAHDPPYPKTLAAFIGYLRAAAIIAGKAEADVGLVKLGGGTYALASLPPVESFLHHLSDHDYVLSEVAMEKVSSVAMEALQANPGWLGNQTLAWKLDTLFTHHGESLYPALVSQGRGAITNAIRALDGAGGAR